MILLLPVVVLLVMVTFDDSVGGDTPGDGTDGDAGGGIG